MRLTSTHPSLPIKAKQPSLQSLLNQLKESGQAVVESFTERYKPQVDQLSDGNNTWWRAYDPKTGKSIYTDSYTELMTWVEQNFREM